jgi:hypothetical protein
METLDDILGLVKETEETRIKQERGGFTPDPRILKFKVGGTYVLRLLFNLKAEGGDKLFVTYKSIGFNSRVTGKYVFGGRAPSDAGMKNDLFKDTQWDHYSKAVARNDEAEKKWSYKLFPQANQMVNAYLVSVTGDDEAKKLEGTDVVIKYAAQTDKDGKATSDLFKKIQSAVIGEKAAKIGKKAFLLDEKGKLITNGKELIVKVVKNAGGWADYSDSEWDDASEIKLSAEQLKAIAEGVHDLREFVPEVKTNDEIKKFLDDHWYGKSSNLEDELTEDEKPSNILKDEDDTDIPMDSGEDDLDKMLASIK